MPLDYPLQDSTATTPTRWDLARTEFKTNVITSFEKYHTPWTMATSKTVGMPGQKQDKFTRVGNMVASVKEPGQIVPTQEVDKKPVYAIIEDKEISSAAMVDRVDDITSHIDLDPAYADKSAEALQAIATQHTLQNLAIGAKLPAEAGDHGYTFPGGNAVNRVVGGATTIEDVYPNTLAGSLALQADLAAIGTAKKNKRVSSVNKDWYAWLTPYLTEVLLNDTNLLSRDYDGAEFNSLIDAKMKRVKNFWIMELPTDEWLPNSDLSTSTDGLQCPEIYGTNSYRGDFRNISFLTQTPESICAVKAGSFITPDLHEINENHARINGASMLKGNSVFRPECCGIGTWAAA